METKKISIIFFAVVLFMACGQTNKKGGETTSEGKVETTAKSKVDTNGIDLKQHGDYTNLYASSSQCKLTAEEVATLYGITVADMKETSNGPSGQGYLCSYNLTLRDGSQSVFGLTFFQKPMSDVQSEISSWQSGSYEKKFLRISNSGDHYIWKHPNQGYFILQNPNYANGIQIRYRTMFKVDKTQSEYLEQKGIQAIDYLIEKYKN
jgi:hypothetical protein